MSRLFLLVTLLLQLAPQVQWKSEVKQSPEGNQIVLTGDLDQQINHVSGTVTYMPCIDEACFMPVDWDFDVVLEATPESSSSELAPTSVGQAGAPGDRSGVAAVPSGNRATLGIVRGGTASEAQRWGPKDVFRGELQNCIAAEVVSSTKIRKALEDGRVEEAEAMLGYAYGLRGVVVSGKQLGRTIGFPTANLRLYDPLKLIPARGVYLTEVEVLGGHFWGMTNVGEPIETHIFDFDEDIYGLDLEIRFRRWLRPMRAMESLDALKVQLAADESACRDILAL